VLRLQQISIGDIRYCDTRYGRTPQNYIFCTPKSGRFEIADKATMSLIHGTAQEIRCKYGVIINKVYTEMLRKLAPNLDNNKDFRDKFFDEIPESKHVLYLLKLVDLEDEDDALVDLEELPGLKEFLGNIPIIKFSKDNVKHIKIEKLDDNMHKLARINENNDTVEKELHNLSEERK
jgi:hypothetical protein